MIFICVLHRGKLRVRKASNLPRIVELVTKELNLNSDLLSLKPKLSASFHSGLPNVLGYCLGQDWVKGGRQRLRHLCSSGLE